MEKEFVPYEQALALKELGFDEPCAANYNNLTGETRFIFGETNKGSLTCNKVTGTNDIVISNERILAPLYSQAIRWFREEHGYFCSPTQSTKPDSVEYDWLITKEFDQNRVFIITVGYFPTYEEAELACLKKLIETVKNK
jgi:hypothetical protein